MPKQYSRKGLKKAGVCKDCKYYIKYSPTTSLYGICDYLEQTGGSRLVKEYENGGYQEDSCVCFKKKDGKKYNGRSRLY